MCGICGVIQVGGAPRTVLDPERLVAMTDSMTHRGPNDRGIYEAPGVAIGVRRLSIVDVDGGHQPFADESGQIVAAQNGELYNHMTLREELVRDGHRFSSRCDTEVLPHLYERRGPDLASYLQGKFAFVVWDAQRRRAVIARDRLGVKPLYWSRVGDLVVFASELRALLASGLVDLALDFDAVDAYFTLGYFPRAMSPLRGVHKLLPGHTLVVDEKGAHTSAYWRYPLPEPPPSKYTLSTCAEELRELLVKAVRRRLMSDVPLGAMLSGGLDSSLIVGLMAAQMSEPVKTFSVGFEEDAEGNELAAARRVAEHFGAEHFELELSLEDTETNLSDLAWDLDEPVADLSALGFLMLSELASEHVTVALAGQGADELFGGYRKHRVASVIRTLSPARGIAGPTMRVARNGSSSWRRMLGSVAAQSPQEMLLAMSGLVNVPTREALYRGPLSAVEGTAARRAIDEVADGRDLGDPLAGLLYLDAQLALPEDMLLYFDRTSMAKSIEVRVPFLDHELVEWAARVPTRLKVDYLKTKRVLKEAARGILPDEVVNRPKLGFFRHASHDWLVAQLRGDLGRQLQDLIDRELAGARNETQLLLAIVMLELWLTACKAQSRAVPISSAR
jgi:asparagine synthase (glutamine-hydrolysing)